MKYFILIASTIFFSVSVKAQAKSKVMDLGNVISDASSLDENLGSNLGLPSIKDSKNTIEIRLYSNTGFPGAQCILVRYDKTWKASKLKLNAKDSAITIQLKPATGIEKVVQGMIAVNVFSLPTQSKLTSGKYSLDLSTNQLKVTAFSISDAACYTIQFKVGDKLRKYAYCEPKQYAAFYKGQHEYADFSAILKSFAKLEIN